MGAMPGMSDDEKPKGKGVDLAIIMGGKPKGGSVDKASKEEESNDGDGLPPGFEEAFSEAFPEAAGDEDRMKALKRLIECCGSY